METASRPILHHLCINNSGKYHEFPRKHLRLLPPFSSTFPRNFNSGRIYLQFKRVNSSSSRPTPFEKSPSQELAVLLEVEGVLMDAYRLGNRQAFNVAFQKLGLDCAHWTEPIYLDLLRKSARDEERMLILYFNRIGWPTSLPTNEKETFMKNVLQEKKNALDDLVMSKSLPLRPGVEDFIDDAYNEGIPLVILTPYSKSGDKIARAIVEKLGDDRLSKIKLVGNEEVEQSMYGRLVLGKGVSASLDEQLAREATKAASAEKQRIAEEVASMLKLSVDIDTSSTESLNADGNHYPSSTQKKEQKLQQLEEAQLKENSSPILNLSLFWQKKTARRLASHCLEAQSPESLSQAYTRISFASVRSILPELLPVMFENSPKHLSNG